MVGLRKGKCYRQLERPYTRKSKYKKKGYIRSFPPHKISRFEMGDKTKKYDFKIKLVSKGSLQLRHNSLESARMVVNRTLETKLGNSYYLKINVFPHHGLRENKMLGGAHADRLQTGMAHSFGKVIGCAAQVKAGKEVFTAWTFKEGIEIAKKALKSATPRLSGSYIIEVETLEK